MTLNLLMKSYNHQKIESKWQKKWQTENLYTTKDSSKKTKFYCLDMFPYPSGEGLHVGHPKGYIATDIYSRYMRMRGFNVLHPMGWDAFGLPAENYAIKHKVHPKISTAKNIKHYKEQLQMLGLSYDWGREIDTTDPTYYKWTQWIFLQMFKKGLAYESYEPINWCPSCQTGLANEDLEDGKCERCGSEIEKKPMRQWVLRITDYADRLLKDLGPLDWPESIKQSQRNWIGRSEGALIKFEIRNSKSETNSKSQIPNEVEVFTTRPDTIFGATFIAVSPEQANKWLENGWVTDKLVIKYIEKILKDRAKRTFKDDPEKTGINSGLKAINPANHEEIPVWITNYVLGDVGTGAIMAVPAHDERDLEFATKYHLPVRSVIEPIFVQKTDPGAVHWDQPFVEREAITAIVKHWSEDKYIGLKWKEVDWDTLITGGVESGQTPEEAALTEIREETGYQNLKLVKILPRTHAKFFHVPKNHNRFAHFHVLYFELKNGTTKDTSIEEKKIHDVKWLTKKEMESFRLPESHRYAWKFLIDGQAFYSGEGIVCNSGKFDGLSSDEAKKAITEAVGGTWTSNYKLKDWVFSRQRYWGEPIPIIYCRNCWEAQNTKHEIRRDLKLRENIDWTTIGGKEYMIVPVPEKDLPVELPKVKSYAPTGTGESPLADIKSWVNTKCPTCNGPAKRETNTMPQWAGSSWYYLRYIDPKNKKVLVDPKKEKYWMGAGLPHRLVRQSFNGGGSGDEGGVDLYVGGTEHATRHLIYARFWHKFLYDIGVVSTSEPFKRFGKSLGLVLGEDGRKMSKRWGNVVNPDDVIATYGADTMRLYEMFMGPFDQEIAWNTKSMIGSRRFLEKVWRLAAKLEQQTIPAVETEIHKTIKKVGEDIENFNFNTAVSSLMILVNSLEKGEVIGREDFKVLLLLLTPFAPHLTEELWQNLKLGPGSIHQATWPKYNETKLVNATVKIVLQVNGKVRGGLTIKSGSSEAEIMTAAKVNEKVAGYLAGREVKRVVFIPNKLVNFVL